MELTKEIETAVSAASVCLLCRNSYLDGKPDENFRSLLNHLRDALFDSNSLATEPDRFRGHYPSVPPEFMGMTGASYHEKARAYAAEVYQRILNLLPFDIPPGSVSRDWEAICRDWPEIILSLAKIPEIDTSRLIDCLRNEATRSERFCKAEQAAVPPPVVPVTGKATVAARMLDLIKTPDTHTWSAREFATKLGCSAPSIVATPAWKQLATARGIAKLERVDESQRKGQGRKIDRHRKPKHDSSYNKGVRD